MLEARRQKYAIPDGAFKRAAMGHYTLIYQLPMWEGVTYYEGGLIEMPDATKHRKIEEAPRGIIVAAGLAARDVLRGNGGGIGHIVSFLELAPFRIECDNIQGKTYHLVIAHVGRITADEDLQDAINSGVLRTDYSKATLQHVYRDREGASLCDSPAAMDTPQEF